MNKNQRVAVKGIPPVYSRLRGLHSEWELTAQLSVSFHDLAFILIRRATHHFASVLYVQGVMRKGVLDCMEQWVLLEKMVK